jgi:hypothetical protein
MIIAQEKITPGSPGCNSPTRDNHCARGVAARVESSESSPTERRMGTMDYDRNKVDDITLALLWLTAFEQSPEVRTWKGHDWNTLDRLHAKGYISDPKSKAKSVVLSNEGEQRARELFEKHFARTN